MKTKIFIAGHNGLVGSAIKRRLEKNAKYEVLSAPRSALDLCNKPEVFDFLETHKPNAIVIAAARVGGIHANSTYPVEFLLENLKIEMNLIEGAHHFGAEQLLFLASNCMYPKSATQPFQEESLLTGAVEPTNDAYATAKIAGWKLCEAYNKQHKKKFITLIPCGMFGLNDNYHAENGHVIPALIRRFHEHKLEQKKTVMIWGSGTPLREFLWADDFAVFAEKALTQPNDFSSLGPINVGAGKELSIREIAENIRNIVYPEAELRFDSSKPDGIARKCLNSSKSIALGHSPSTSFSEGIQLMYKDFLNNPLVRK